MHVVFPARFVFKLIVYGLVGGISGAALIVDAEIEEVVVTAQLRAEQMQQVPISISVFDQRALTQRQIETFSDLQFNLPNVSYSKGNYSGNNFQIRGVGTLLTAVSADSGVAIHVNGVYLNSPRLFETEFYDMEQIEILRGPQGTLFGRNATGGVVNVKTARPEPNEFFGELQAQLGQYAHQKTNGMVNIPLGNRVTARIAGSSLRRDGYSENMLTDHQLDGRDQWSLRGSAHIELTQNHHLDVVTSRYRENSSRTRSQKQLCNHDPSGILGCLPDGDGFGSVNGFATIGTLLASNLVLGERGLFNFFDSSLDDDIDIPTDMRQIRSVVQPIYQAEENYFMLEYMGPLTDTLDITAIASHQTSTTISRQAFYGDDVNGQATKIPDKFCAMDGEVICHYFGTAAGGGLFVSTGQHRNESLGALSGPGNFTLVGGRNASSDLSYHQSAQDSGELRIASSLSGPLNFLIAGNYLSFEAQSDYLVLSPILDYVSVGLGQQQSIQADTHHSSEHFIAMAPGYFNSETDVYRLESLGIFGELYWQATQSIKFTLGLRYSKDDKYLRDRQALLSLPVLVDVIDNAHYFLGSDGSSTSVASRTELFETAAALGDFDADSGTIGNQAYRQDSVDFRRITGRWVVDWFPDWKFTDESLLYFSYARGGKGGGINPPVDEALYPGTVAGFSPEQIDAFELGTKNTLWDHRINANLSVFYYNYQGLQIGKMVNRTVVNENTDADIYGAELEVHLSLGSQWDINLEVAALRTTLGGRLSVDPRDPTQGQTDVTLIKDIADAGNCLIAHKGQVPLADNRPAIDGLAKHGVPLIPTGRDLSDYGGPEGVSVPATPGVSHSAISSCAAISRLAPAFGYFYLDGIPANLQGNSLIQVPAWSVNFGVQYEHQFANGFSLVGRADYYWQDDYYTTTFNQPQDRVASWDLWNAQLILNSSGNSRGSRWFATLFVQNIEDDDEIVGTFSTDPSAGLFTNVFLTEPRLIGMSLGITFN